MLGWCLHKDLDFNVSWSFRNKPTVKIIYSFPVCKKRLYYRERPSPIRPTGKVAMKKNDPNTGPEQIYEISSDSTFNIHLWTPPKSARKYMWKYRLLEVVLFSSFFGLGKTLSIPVDALFLFIPIWWLWFHTLWFTLIHPSSLDHCRFCFGFVKHDSKIFKGLAANFREQIQGSVQMTAKPPKNTGRMTTCQGTIRKFCMLLNIWSAWKSTDRDRDRYGSATKPTSVSLWTYSVPDAWIFGSWFHSLLKISIYNFILISYDLFWTTHSPYPKNCQHPPNKKGHRLDLMKSSPVNHP